MNVLLYFGSFNPIHNGHVAIARWAAEHVAVDEVWLVVSPQNPLRDDLAPQEDRLAMARLAVADRLDEASLNRLDEASPQGVACLNGKHTRVSDVEFGLPKPSYTIDTLRFLTKEHPDCRFSILAGGDIVAQLPRWKDYEELLRNFNIYIYPRHSEEPRSGDVEPASEASLFSNITLLDNAPQLEFSSTDVRETLLAGGDIKAMVPEKVAEYIETHKLWRPTTAAGWLERGRRHQRAGQLGMAMSDLLRAAALDPTDTEVQERLAMLREIFAYRYTDYYNP